jgi:hypothetical protein
MSSLTLPQRATGTSQGIREMWCRRVLLVASAVAALALACHFALMLWAQNEFSTPESVVAAQSMMLAHEGTLYYSLHDYPYTVCAYMPIFYGLEAGLIKAGLGAYMAARLISFAAMLGIFALVWRLSILYTRNRYYAWTGVILCVSTSLLLTWGTVGQVDTLAVFFGLLGFYQYARYAIRGESTLLLAAVCVIAAFLTKQTMVACPAAIVLLLWFRNRKVALQFAAAVGGVILLAVLSINAALDGRFLSNTLFANLNPFSWGKIQQHAQYLAMFAGELVIVTAVGFRAVMRSPAKALFVYLGLAACVLGATAPKIGSDSNYQIETTVLLVLCTVVALDALDFYPLVFGGSTKWVTLLQIPLAIHLVLNFRMIEPFLLARFVKEQQFRAQLAAERPYLANGGRVISADMNEAAHTRGRLEVEPLIYTLLVRAGRIDPEPVRRDIAAKKFSTIILYRDVNRPFDSSLELLALSDAQLDEVRKHYRIAAHIPGPYLDGIYVYKSLPEGRQ